MNIEKAAARTNELQKNGIEIGVAIDMAIREQNEFVDPTDKLRKMVGGYLLSRGKLEEELVDVCIGYPILGRNWLSGEPGNVSGFVLRVDDPDGAAATE